MCGNAEHLPCFAHSLQLVVRDGLSSLTAARTLLGICVKLSSLLHHSAVFRGAFEQAVGPGRSIPTVNNTRWNSMFMQLSAINVLDLANLNGVLHATDHDNLVLTSKECIQLKELVDILTLFADAISLMQGDQMVTLSCVVPCVFL